MQAEKLRECLANLNNVVIRYEMGRLDFSKLALDWLSKAETQLREERRPEATEILTARTNVISSIDRSKEEGKHGTARRRAEAIAAIDAICVAETLLRKRLLTLEDEIDAYEDKLVEAVTGLTVLGHLPSMAGVGRNFWAQQVWSALETQEATRPTAIWLSTALAVPDRMFLLDRVLQRVRSSQLPIIVAARGPESAN
jgi:hypothetical protein